MGHRPKFLKLLEEIQKENAMTLGKPFLGTIQNAQATKDKTDWTSSKLKKKNYASNVAMKVRKKPHRMEENICKPYICREACI